MYIKIKKLEVVQDKFGSHLAIKMVGLYDENDKWIKWIKLTEITNDLLEAKIPIDHE